jgi:hypothetical protein
MTNAKAVVQIGNRPTGFITAQPLPLLANQGWASPIFNCLLLLRTVSRDRIAAKLGNAVFAFFGLQQESLARVLRRALTSRYDLPVNSFCT